MVGVVDRPRREPQDLLFKLAERGELIGRNRSLPVTIFGHIAGIIGEAHQAVNTREANSSRQPHGRSRGLMRGTRPRGGTVQMVVRTRSGGSGRWAASANTAPNANPPICAHQATPPAMSGDISSVVPCISCKANQTTANTTAGIGMNSGMNTISTRVTTRAPG